MSQILRDSRKYEEIREQFISSEERPVYHLSSRVGWMNDPNGFSFYDGQVHLFYQYHPYSSMWGPMHWGHAVTSDFMHWEYLPTAIAPDMPYDHAGCFSGNATILPDGRHLLMYTGVSKTITEEGEMRNLQTQCLAIGDGLDYQKYHKNPVLTVDNMPKDASPFDFRDPKMWKMDDGTYRCAVVNNKMDGTGGRILLYESKDGFQWNFLSEMLTNDNNFGRMWECPDFFCLDGKDVVLLSPQDMLPEGLEYHNGDGTLCLIGKFDEETKKFTPEYDQAVDYGIDFYAPQTLQTPDGRRIMIGWMQNWDTCASDRIPRGKWFGQMSIPREISIKNNRLYQWPVREFNALRKNSVAHKNVVLSGEMSFPDIKGRVCDIELSIRPSTSDAMYHKFTIRVACSDKYHTNISFRPHESVLKIDRKFSGSRRAIIHQRRAGVRAVNGELKLRILLDRFSMEVFVGDGEQVMSATLNTEQVADGISFNVDGCAEMDIVKYDIM